MKPNRKLIASAAATAMLAWTALAQESVPPTADQAALQQRMWEQRLELFKKTAPVSAIIGRKVEDKQNEELGRVQDVLVNLGSGRIQEVILSADKYPGPNQRLTSVPPEALVAVDSGLDSGRVLQLDASPDKFSAAPRYDATVTDEGSESNHLVAVYDYYGEPSYFPVNQAGRWTTNQAINAQSSLGPVLSARHLLGRPVRNLQDEKLGKVKSLIVDLAAGRVAGVIITSHGFLGTDAEFSSAPLTAFQYDSARDLLQLDATPEMLATSPAFLESAWQDFPVPGSGDEKYYPYRIAPFNHSGAPSVTKGSRQVDEDLLARIRTVLQNDPRLSVNARHVQIITQKGLVTLRGPVNNNDEKQLVGQIVQQAAINEQVDNELEVQLTTAN